MCLWMKGRKTEMNEILVDLILDFLSNDFCVFMLVKHDNPKVNLHKTAVSFLGIARWTE